MTLDDRTREQEAFDLFLHALEREQMVWHEYHIAWRSYVRDRSDSADQRWDELGKEHRALRQRSGELFEQWRQIAYPLHGFALTDDGRKAS